MHLSSMQQSRREDVEEEPLHLCGAAQEFEKTSKILTEDELISKNSTVSVIDYAQHFFSEHCRSTKKDKK